MIEYYCDFCRNSIGEPYATITVANGYKDNYNKDMHLCKTCHLLLQRAAMYPMDLFKNYDINSHMEKLGGGSRSKENDEFNQKERSYYDTEEIKNKEVKSGTDTDSRLA